MWRKLGTFAELKVFPAKAHGTQWQSVWNVNLKTLGSGHGSGVWVWERDWADLLIANRLQLLSGNELCGPCSSGRFEGGCPGIQLGSPRGRDPGRVGGADLPLELRQMVVQTASLPENPPAFLRPLHLALNTLRLEGRSQQLT